MKEVTEKIYIDKFGNKYFTEKECLEGEKNIIARQKQDKIINFIFKCWGVITNSEKQYYYHDRQVENIKDFINFYHKELLEFLQKDINNV